MEFGRYLVFDWLDPQGRLWVPSARGGQLTCEGRIISGAVFLETHRYEPWPKPYTRIL